MNILVVEDDPDARKVLSLILKLDGFEVSTVSGGREAIDAIRAAAPDLILLDVMMPDVDGFEVCRRIRSEPATRGIPIVMLSGKADQESVVRGLAAGANEFLSKPIKPSSLTKQLRSTLMRTAASMSTS
ncbi:MAG TPA: response regulator [Anaerolineae bacterium]|nr:response regulator [Anaerolineae bacterium]